MKRTLVVCGLIGAVLVTPAWAILGIGDIVFDPTNYEEAVQQLVQLQQQYEQLVRTYQTVRDQYAHMLYMAQRVPVDMVQRYRALATPWRNSSATNTYGSTTGWITGINTGLGVASGYQQATQRLAAYESLDAIPASHQDRVKSNYATVELADGANMAGMEVVGRLRANSPALDAAIQRLESDSLSSNADMNTEIAVLNKINAADVIGLRNVHDTNQLLVALTEQQIIESKRIRDAEAQAINNHVRFIRDGKAALDSQAAGASAAMLAWRMP